MYWFASSLQMQHALILQSKMEHPVPKYLYIKCAGNYILFEALSDPLQASSALAITIFGIPQNSDF